MNLLEFDDGDTQLQLLLLSPASPPHGPALRFRVTTESHGFRGRQPKAKILTADFEAFLAAARQLAAGDRPSVSLAALDPEDFMLRLRRQHGAVSVEGFVGEAYADFRGWPRRHRLDFGLRLTPEQLAGALDAFSGWRSAVGDRG